MKIKKQLSMVLASSVVMSSVAMSSGVEATPEAEKAQERPNIIYVMCDDLSAQTIGALNGRYKDVFPTPNMDRIAKEGAALTQTYCTNAICVPSRAVIMTGKYAQENGVYTLGNVLDPSINTFPQMMQKAGYETAIVGKWHLGTEPKGFDYYSVMQGQGQYFDCPFIDSKDSPKWPNYPEDFKGHGSMYAKPNRETKGHITDVATDIAIDWIDNRDKNKPFMIMLHYKAPHGPITDFDPKYKEFLADINLPLPESFLEDRSTRDIAARFFGSVRYQMKDSYTDNDRQKANASYQTSVKNYLRLVKGIDDNLGRLLEYVDKNRLTDNTVFVFTSDQGTFLGEHTLADKRWIFEDSMKMLLCIRYPKEIKPGTVCDDLISNVDYAPTLLDYAGIEKAPDMQGRSFRKNITGDTPPDWQKEIYFRYWAHGDLRAPAHYGLRTKDYLFVKYYGMPLNMTLDDAFKNKWTPVGAELFDLRQDPLELINVYYVPAYKDILKEMEDRLYAKKKQINDEDNKYPEIVKRFADFEAGKDDEIPADMFLAIKNDEIFKNNDGKIKIDTKGNLEMVKKYRQELIALSQKSTLKPLPEGAAILEAKSNPSPVELVESNKTTETSEIVKNKGPFQRMNILIILSAVTLAAVVIMIYYLKERGIK